MKTRILVILSTLLILSIAAVPVDMKHPVLNVARAELINKTGYELQVKIEEVGKPLNVHYITIAPGDKDNPEAVKVDLHALGEDWEWYVTGWANTGEFVYNEYGTQTKYTWGVPCFGEADYALWDDNQARRIFVIKGVGENKNKINFTEDSCEVPPPKWFSLIQKNYRYAKGDDSWKY